MANQPLQRKYRPLRSRTATTQGQQPIANSIIGVKGLKNLGGRIQEEYDQSLTSWDTAVKIYIEMMDDLTIGTQKAAMTLPLLAADFDVEAASDGLTDIAARDWLWDVMNSMDRQTWRSHVEDMLFAPWFGWAIGEIVLEKRRDGRLWLKNIDPRGQETLHKWEFDEFDHTIGFWQQDPNRGAIVKIPIDKTVHVTFGGRKGNPQGRGMLRVLYRTWRFLKELENLEAIGLERNVGGMPVATLPPEPLTSDDISKLQAALRDLRMDEEMYLILPNGLTVNPYSGAMNVAPMGIVIDRKQKEILQLGFAQFIKLGMREVGTQALVKGSQDFFTLGLISVQQQLLEAWNQQLVPFLFRYNAFSFPGMTGYPKITWTNPGKVDITSVLNAYNTAITAKAMTATRQDEEHFRSILDMPDLPEGVGEEVRLPVPPPIPGLPGPLPFSHYAEGDPDLRSGSGDYEKVTNKLQRSLLSIYDRWAIDTRNQILAAQERGISSDNFSRIIAGKLTELETNLVEAQRNGILASLGVSVALSMRESTRVRGAIMALSTEAVNGIRTGLISSIRDRLTAKMQGAMQFDRSSLKEIFDSARFSVAASAGVGWAALFTGLVAAGVEQEARTGRTQRVRWVLNDLAEHCAESPGRFGCPQMAGVYNSWAELSTVPAAMVTCRGNCRCRLEVETEPGSNVWARGLQEFNP